MSTPDPRLKTTSAAVAAVHQKEPAPPGDTTTTLRNFGSVLASNQAPPRFDERDLTPLGKIHGVAYATTPTGLELRMGQEVWISGDQRWPKNTVHVTRRRQVAAEGYMRVGGTRQTTRSDVFTAEAAIVPEGTFQALQEQADAAAKARARRAKPDAPRLWDLADTLPQLARQPEQALALGVSADPEFDQVKKVEPKLLMSAGREPVRGVQEILGWVTANGVELDVYGDHLALRGRMVPVPVAEVVTAFERLLVAELRRSPLRCELPHRRDTPAAFTLLVGGAACCRKHLEELAA